MKGFEIGAYYKYNCEEVNAQTGIQIITNFKNGVEYNIKCFNEKCLRLKYPGCRVYSKDFHNATKINDDVEWILFKLEHGL